jgi:osmotically inducible protein OsmC
MAFSNALAKSGHPPASLDTTANVTFQAGTGITGVALSVTGDVPGMTAEEFEEAAEAAKTACPVSQALKAVPITLEAHFKG